MNYSAKRKKQEMHLPIFLHTKTQATSIDNQKHGENQRYREMAQEEEEIDAHPWGIQLSRD